ncbi:unnamed protein product [Prorocentrum cordatum]|uniref:Uncharacterized protein n=1 Tax=Prorocentrum cordatum TaxID=2364126 RepID=A0ABN9USI9_9DINO|nr:unnamed protein product [Polarella glacialis]
MGLEQSLRLCWHTEGAMLSDRSPMPSRSDQPGVEATKGLSNARPPAGERFKIPGHSVPTTQSDRLRPRCQGMPVAETRLTARTYYYTTEEEEETEQEEEEEKEQEERRPRAPREPPRRSRLTCRLRGPRRAGCPEHRHAYPTPLRHCQMADDRSKVQHFHYPKRNNVQ